MSLRRQVKNFMKNYSEAEIKVREATSNDPWGPSSSLMLAISDMTFNTASLSEIMHMIWQRLGDHGKNWRHVYKCLALMDYLIKNGSKKVIQCCREGLCNLQMLKDFQHVDEAGKDQGRYIREKSKQIITLLMDEQLLFKEREVASWTRQRTSYSMTFPTRLPATGSSPAPCASVLIPESLASEKKHSLLTIASLRNKKNTSKARLRLEQFQDSPSPPGSSLAKVSPPPRMKTWKSTEDLTLLHDECPKQLLPEIPPSITSPTSWMSEGEAEVCNLWDTDAVSTPSEKRPSMQTNMSLGKRLEKTITNALTESPPQTPQEKQTATKSFETLTPLQAFRPPGKDEFNSLGLRMSKSASVFPNRSSVETLYVSPSFKTDTPEKEPRSSKALQTPKKSRLCWMEDMKDVSLKPLAMRDIINDERANAVLTGSSKEGHASFCTTSIQQCVRGPSQAKSAIGKDRRCGYREGKVSTASEVASSFSTLSVSSPDLVHPKKSAHHFPLVFTSPSFWIQPHQKPSSAPFTYKDEAARVRHPFVPRSTASSDDEEYPSIPDNSNSVMEKPGHFPSCHQVAFSTPTRTYFPSVSQASLQTREGLPRESPESGSIRTLLVEVRGAVLRLHEDLSLVIQELSVINNYLGKLSGSSQAASEALQSPQSSRGSSDPI
ncbi:ENTH domain-containing protein 1 isoform X1 [Mesocricetus auratus]|uniref:ENTH domain-containing protein 1 isoform X1 n=1 Tax=Mesocricetus auratus TaxID=10036 RepID=A0A3Q0CF34_MESAU|nr:ENTH domain-containing protein 1 isoform X1 [Mesocricetus auratus]